MTAESANSSKFKNNFSISKLEEECFGGKMESNNDEHNLNFRASHDSIQSAYMLIYERRIKSPLKVVVPKPNTDVISYKEEELMKIKKEYNLFYHMGKPSYHEIYNKIFNSTFHDIAKDEYYQFRPFFSVERQIPRDYFLEIMDDNTQLQKQQNISDEQFMNFFDSVIHVLDDTLSKIHDMKDETGNKIVSTFMNFIFNILSQKDKQKVN